MGNIKTVNVKTTGLDDKPVEYEFQIMPTNIGNKVYHEYVLGFLSHMVSKYGMFNAMLAGMVIPQVYEWDDIKKISKAILSNTVIHKEDNTYICNNDGNCDLFDEVRNERYVAIYYAMLENFRGDLAFFGIAPKGQNVTEDKAEPETDEP